MHAQGVVINVMLCFFFVLLCIWKESNGKKATGVGCKERRTVWEANRKQLERRFNCKGREGREGEREEKQ